MIEDKREYEDLLLAAWLHDIGKFYQRAGFKLSPPKDEEVMTMFAKKQGEGIQARYSHLHAIFSDKFFREYLPTFDVAGTLTALHHSPENASEKMRYLAKIITLADWMASGERRERESEEDSEGYQAEPLISIFSRLSLGDEDQENKGKESPAFVPLVELEASLESIFPVSSKEQAFKNGDGRKSYEALWREFLADLEKIDKRFLLEQIPFLLEKFTLTIPSTTVDKPDISLYHHAKSTAAIASCLYKLHPDEKILDSLFDEIRSWLNSINIKIQERQNLLQQNQGAWPNLIKKDFLLVGGDISGIQDFIYSVTSEKALKGLKGRSFYLQLISEATSRLILDEFNLTEANLLYSGGGHFYLLIPKIEDAESKLKKIRLKIDEILLQAHKGKLALVLDWVSLNYADFFINFVSPWTDLTAKLGQLKKKKFASLLASPNLKASSMDTSQCSDWEGKKEEQMGGDHEIIQKIMGPFDMGGERKACEICGEELEKEEEETCSLCQSFVSLSDELKRATAIKLEKTSPRPLPSFISASTWKDVLLAMGFDCHLWKQRKDGNESEVKGESERSPSYLRGYLVLNSTEFAGHFAGYKFIATKISGPDGTTLTLEKMADQAEGIKKWGVLRADVDGLGEVFKGGLGEDKTISRMCMLSSMLSLYFGARLNDLHRLKEETFAGNKKGGGNFLAEFLNYKEELLDYIYIAYSGGDDLFLIGPWSVLPNLAIRLYDDFHRFTSQKLTLSAGLYLAPTKKFPLYQAALEAGEAEGDAKKAGRHRICFLEKPMTCEKLKEVREVAYRIKNLLEKKNKEEKANTKAVPRALLSVLYDAYQEKELRLKEEIPMERIWRLFYAFKKIMEKFKKEENVLGELNWLLKKAITDFEIYPELNVAARWAEYLTREEKT